jgi:hypothetical protein
VAECRHCVRTPEHQHCIAQQGSISATRVADNKIATAACGRPLLNPTTARYAHLLRSSSAGGASACLAAITPLGLVMRSQAARRGSLESSSNVSAMLANTPAAGVLAAATPPAQHLPVPQLFPAMWRAFSGGAAAAAAAAAIAEGDYATPPCRNQKRTLHAVRVCHYVPPRIPPHHLPRHARHKPSR